MEYGWHFYIFSFKRVLSVSLTSSRQSCSFTKSILHLFPHNMFRRLASCSRGGFDKTDKTSQQTKVVEIFWPQKVKVESKDLWIWFKKLNPTGVSPPWGSPAISLPLLIFLWFHCRFCLSVDLCISQKPTFALVSMFLCFLFQDPCSSDCFQLLVLNLRIHPCHLTLTSVLWQ